MKKLIGMSLMALFAMTAVNTDAQFFSKMKNKVTGNSEETYKVKHKNGGTKVKGGSDAMMADASYTTVKSKPHKHKMKAVPNESYSYATVKSKPGKHKVKSMSSTPVTTVKNKPGKHKVKTEQQYAMTKTKNGKHKMKL